MKDGYSKIVCIKNEYTENGRLIKLPFSVGEVLYGCLIGGPFKYEYYNVKHNIGYGSTVIRKDFFINYIIIERNNLIDEILK